MEECILKNVSYAVYKVECGPDYEKLEILSSALTFLRVEDIKQNKLIER